MTRTGVATAARDFIQSAGAGGLMLIGVAIAAMVIANIPGLAEPYAALLGAPIGPLTVLLWINDGAMALFFLLVGLEIKRELIEGELASPARRRLPVIAATAGMAVPTAIYLLIAGGHPRLVAGWAIPAATDIAFAIGVLTLLGPRVPASLKLFLTTVAVVDDLGAVAIIALFYSHGIDWAALAAASGVLAIMAAMNRRDVVSLVPYLLAAALLWVLVLRSGVHATVAGVLAAALVPMGQDGHSPLHRLEHALAPWVNYGVLPLFAFANAGVSLAGVDLAVLTSPLVLAIVAGLVLGKPIGILGSIALASALGIARPPRSSSWGQLLGMAMLGGIGFTMSLFIGGLAFPGDAPLMREVKIGVLAGSTIAAIAGYAVLRLAAASARRH